MDHLKASFERELKNKLAEKTKGAQSEESVLKKAFKYFDLNDNGTVEPDEFAKAIEKIGIQIPTKQDLNTLFNIYDLDGSGTLDYNEFSAVLFNKGNATPSRPGTAQSMNPEQLAEALQQKLASRGARGIIGLARQFKIMDDDNSKSLSKGEFNKAMADFALGFTPQQCSTLFDYFDVDKGGSIDYDEFLRAIRGPMNSNRKQIVMKAFAKLDKDGNGWIDISDIRGVYNAKKHPDVLAGKKTEDDILKEFLATFEMAHSMRNNDAPNYVVTKEEFVEYYNMISCSIDDDRYFQQMMLSCWKMDEAAKAQEAATRKRAAMDNDIFGTAARREETAKRDANVPTIAANANDQQLMEHIRSRIAARGASGIQGIGRKFKIADDDRSGALNKEEFKKAMHDFRIGLNPAQVGRAFDLFDRDGSGEISYDEFLRSIRGKMNPTRAAIAKQAYKIMDKDGSGVLDINDIRQTYNAKQHPDVKAGKKTEDEILGEFLNTFEDHFASMQGNADARDGSITVEEWLEYYNNVSMSIDNDEYFKLMMNNTWNLDGKKETRKGWGGEV